MTNSAPVNCLPLNQNDPMTNLGTAMNYLRTVFATDDNENLIREHFGDADRYMICDISPTECIQLNTIPNLIKTPDENEHGDGIKAAGISGLFKDYTVHVLVNQAFGRNIEAMRKKYVPVIIAGESINEAIVLIQKNFSTIVQEFEKGPERKHLRLR